MSAAAEAALERLRIWSEAYVNTGVALYRSDAEMKQKIQQDFQLVMKELREGD